MFDLWLTPTTRYANGSHFSRVLLTSHVVPTMIFSSRTGVFHIVVIYFVYFLIKNECESFENRWVIGQLMLLIWRTQLPQNKLIKVSLKMFCLFHIKADVLPGKLICFPRKHVCVEIIALINRAIEIYVFVRLFFNYLARGTCVI